MTGTTKRNSQDQPGAASAGPTIGLALGGGGARGLAHILVLEVFDELGLRPHLIAGTSIGALFAAAYASGLTASEIRERAEGLLGKRTEIARRLLASPPDSLLELWSLRPLSAALLNPEALLDIVLPDALAARFSGLDPAVLVVATDYYAQAPHVIDRGSLVPALAASIALPALFRPVVLDDRVLVDGGLTNPLPFDLIEARSDVTVAVDVTGGRVPKRDGSPPSAIETTVAASQIMQAAIVREKLARHQPDIVLRPAVERFRILEFYKVAEILAAAAPLKDELKRALDTALSAAGERTP